MNGWRNERSLGKSCFELNDISVGEAASALSFSLIPLSFVRDIAFCL